MKKLVTPFRVGLLVIAAGGILFFFLTFVKKGGMKESESLRAHAYFRDASGLGPRSRVQIAGIPVGEVVSVKLEGTRARIEMRLSTDVGVRRNAALTKRSESLLGDYMLDLIPGTDDQPLLEDGGEIGRVIDAQGMEQIFNSLATITGDIQAVTASLRAVLGGTQGQGSIESIVQNLVKLTEAVEKTVRENALRLDQILANVEAVSGDVRRVTENERASVQNIVQNIDTISTDVKDVVASVKKMVGENEGDVAGTMSSLKETLAKLDRSLANVEQITQDIKQGKGAAGALLQDDRLAQKVTDTVEDISDFAQRLTGFQLEVSMRADYLTQQSGAKTFFGARLITRPDKYYLIEVVDDPRGTVETTYVQQNPPGSGQPVAQKQIVTREGVKFSAQFAKRYSWLTLRFGIIESSGGLGADFNVPIKFPYYSRWLEDALAVKVDVFNFSIEALRLPRLRATLRFTPIEHIFVNVGVDDVLNTPNRDSLTNRLVSGRDFFFGAGIYFTDSDLKSLLPILPTP